jgi:hypothetical protein
MAADLTTPEGRTELLEREKEIERIKRRARRDVDAEEQPAQPLRYLTVDDLFKQPRIDYLVDQFLPQKALAELVGDSESLKSFFAIDLGLTIATEKGDFFGLRVVKHGPVIYIAAEGANAFQFRVRAWAQEHDVDLADAPFFTVPVPVNLRDPQLQEQLAGLIAEKQPVLIIVDTLHRCLPGADDNGARDMGEVVAFAQRLQYEHGTAVLFLHHPPKNDPKGRGRGSSVVYYAADTEILASLEKDSDRPDGTKTVNFEVVKQKDDQKVTLALTNRIVPVHNDLGLPLCYDSGRPITSCVLQLADAEAVAETKQDNRTQFARRVLKYVTEHPGQSVNEVCKGVGGKKQQVGKAIEALLKAGRMVEEKGARGAKCLTALPESESEPAHLAGVPPF